MAKEEHINALKTIKDTSAQGFNVSPTKYFSDGHIAEEIIGLYTVVLK